MHTGVLNASQKSAVVSTLTFPGITCWFRTGPHQS